MCVWCACVHSHSHVLLCQVQQPNHCLCVHQPHENFGLCGGWAVCVQQGHDSSVCFSFSLHPSVPQTSAAVCCLGCVPNPARHDADAQGLSVGQLMCNPHLPLVWEGCESSTLCSMHCVCWPVKWPFVKSCADVCAHLWSCVYVARRTIPPTDTACLTYHLHKPNLDMRGLYRSA